MMWVFASAQRKGNDLQGGSQLSLLLIESWTVLLGCRKVQESLPTCCPGAGTRTSMTAETGLVPVDPHLPRLAANSGPHLVLRCAFCASQQQTLTWTEPTQCRSKALDIRDCCSSAVSLVSAMPSAPCSCKKLSAHIKTPTSLPVCHRHVNPCKPLLKAALAVAQRYISAGLLMI